MTHETQEPTRPIRPIRPDTGHGAGPRRRMMLYPLWLRIWHWSNAALFLILLVTGASLHFAAPDAPWIPFRSALMLHNVAGLLLAALYLLFVVLNARSGNWRHYLPLRVWPPEVWPELGWRLWSQGKFYAVDIFLGKPHPFPSTARQKFNPLQQLTYLGVAYGMLPLLIITGIWYFFPEYAPDQVLGLGGVWPVALMHYLLGVVLTVFLIGHVYLATAGETLSGEMRKMVTGWDEVVVEEEEHSHE